MAFSIKSSRADELLAELRAITGEGITDAVIHALESRLAGLQRQAAVSDVDWKQQLQQIQIAYRHLARRPEQPTDESLMYDADGLPA